MVGKLDHYFTLDAEIINNYELKVQVEDIFITAKNKLDKLSGVRTSYKYQENVTYEY